MATTANGVCAVKLGDSDEQLARDLRENMPRPRSARASRPARNGSRPSSSTFDGELPALDLPIDVRATAFQWKVWRALQAIPYGETSPTPTWPAPSAGRGPLARWLVPVPRTRCAVVVPCHRVVQSDGGLGGYRWGVERKEKLLRKEAGTGS